MSDRKRIRSFEFRFSGASNRARHPTLPSITLLLLLALAGINVFGLAACSRATPMKPWAERRGLEIIGQNSSTILVRASVDAVSEYLESVGLRPTRDAVGKRVRLRGTGYASFQIEGQAWTLIVGEPRLRAVDAAFPGGISAMSAHLECEVVWLSMSDTVGVVEYAIADRGALVEEFLGSESDDVFESKWSSEKYRRIELPASRDDPDYRGCCFIWRRNGDYSVPSGSGPWNMAERMLRKRQAYDPGFLLGYFIDNDSLQPAGEFQVRNDGRVILDASGREYRDAPTLVRVDLWSNE